MSARLLVVTLALLCAGCSSTQLTTTWKDPAAGPLAFKRVLVMAVNAEVGERRAIEDELVAHAKSASASASYTIIPESDSRNREKIKAILREKQFDGVLVLRLVASDKELTYVPGSPYNSFWGYYDYAWPAVYSPGYVRADTIIRASVNLYRTENDKLVWSAASETFNPASARALAQDIAEATAKELKKQGLIANPPL